MNSDFPNHWQIMPLAQAMEAIIDYRGKTPLKSDVGIPLITAKIVKGGRIEEPSEFIAEELYADWMVRGFPNEGDVVITTEAPLGEVAQIDNPHIALAQRIVTLRGIKGLLDNNFLLYLMQSEYVRKQLEARASGSTVLGIKQSELRKISLIIPPIEEQVQIAHHLKSIDKKIELNRQINQTLEAMAQALFKSWFVDFEPVRAKIAAIETGEDVNRACMRAISGKTDVELDKLQITNADEYAQLHAIASLFPNDFIESELGSLPRGWEVKRIEEVAKKIGMGPFGSNIKVSTFAKSGMPIINGQQLRESLLSDFDFKFISEDHAKKLFSSCVRRGDLVFTHRGNIGQVSLIPPNSFYSDYIISQSQFYLRPDEDKVRGTFLIYFFRSSQGQHTLLANAAQVGVPSISKPSSYLKSIKIILPSLEILDAFDRSVLLISVQINLLKQQSKELTTLRDTLLPKLLSGGIQFRIKDN